MKLGAYTRWLFGYIAKDHYVEVVEFHARQGIRASLWLLVAPGRRRGPNHLQALDQALSDFIEPGSDNY